ncbi:MAG: T9SS type A sorting domain-containing protein [Candidatus Cloacimonetes bacterium]|nr:T9SS type A sorting domain-containing protein [Candidatus Cloacimonadota bacterium]
MKKFLLIITVLFICSSAFADIIEKTYYFDDPDFIQIDAQYQLISFESTLQSAPAGSPSVPYYAVSLLLPSGQEAYEVEVIPENKTAISGLYELYPMQHVQPYSKGSRGEFVIDQDIYNKAKPYPESIHGTLSTHYMNGYGFAFTTITPVEYIPKEKSISYYKSITVRIHTKPEKNEACVAIPAYISDSQINTLKQLAQNDEMFSTYQRNHRDGGYEILLITPEAFMNDFSALTGMYLTQGLRTEIATTQSINLSMSGIDLQEKIRNYIIQEYQTNGILHVILGGDDEHIPHRGFFCEVQSSSVYTDDDIPADLYYSALDGTWNDDGDNLWGEIGEDDLLPDVSVGRISFSDSIELAHILNKTMMYQENPVPGELTKPILAGEHLWNDPQTWGGDYLDLLIGYHEDNGYTTDGIPADQNIEKLYDRELGYWDSSTLISKINEGKSYIHHSGHANTTYCMRMNSSDITNSNFSNVNGITHNYTHIYTHGCLSGAFDSNDCIAEKIVNLENFAASFIGNSRYGWFNEGQTEGPSEHLHREYVNALYTLRTDRIGEAHLNSKINTAPWVNAPGQHEEGALRWCFYCCNVIGDPVMPIWTDEPINIEVIYPDSIFIGQDQVQVTVTSIGTDTEGLICTLLKNGEFHGSAAVNAIGVANINIDPIFSDVGTAQLIVTGYNCLKSTYNVTIIPCAGAYIIIDSVATKDDNNNVPEYSEEVSFDFVLKNVGTQDATNVTATLSSDDEYITCSYSSAFFDTIFAGGTATQENVLPIIVDDYVPDQHVAVISMDITADGKQNWDTQFAIILNAPVLEMGNCQINDSAGNNDGILDPGETVIMTIPTLNTGHAISPEAQAILSCSENLITIQNTNISLGQIEAGETTNANFTVTASSQLEEGSAVIFEYDVIAGEYELVEEIGMTIGLIIEDFETGDFSMYDWYFGGNADWTISETNPYEGNYCVKSGDIPNNSESSLKIDVEVFADGMISFWKKVSSENNYDYLQFYIDGSLQEEWSGESPWSEESYNVSSGVHSFEWRYDKDEYMTGGQDRAWIDYIIFPPLGAPTSNDEPSQITQNFLAENFPNPFGNITNIRFALKNPAKVTIDVYNILGQKVKTITEDEFPAGVHSTHWDGKDAFGHPVANGVYFYRMNTEEFYQTRKMILMK